MNFKNIESMVNRSLRIIIFLVGLLIFVKNGSFGQLRSPELGSEILLQPGPSTKDIPFWVKTLSESNMPFARIFINWEEIEPRKGVWNFKVYDTLFRAAERYGVKISPTLSPSSPPFFLRGRKLKDDKKDLTNPISPNFNTAEAREAAKEYVKKVVERYRNSPALSTWWLFNEPHGYPVNTPLAISEFKKWLRSKYKSIYILNEKWNTHYSSFEEIEYSETWVLIRWGSPFPLYDWSTFWKEHINNQIQWLRREVEKYDTTHPFTTNPNSFLNSLAHDDLLGMANKVDYLGASMHPSWFFTWWIPNRKYGATISYMNNLLNTTSNGRSHWVSELQAGSNWHSFKPLNPSAKELTKWVWTSIGGGASKVIFWLLNPVMAAQESAEWGLFDFQQKPSLRLQAVTHIANTIKENPEIFSNMRPVKSPVTIIVSSRTLLTQEKKFVFTKVHERPDKSMPSEISAVAPLAHQKAVLAFYYALLGQGLRPQIELMEHFNWYTSDSDQVAILPDVSVLSRTEMDDIKAFVEKGNKIIVTGRTGLYDEDEKAWVINRRSPLEEVLGGAMQDMLSDSIRFEINVDQVKMPAQLIYTSVVPSKGRIIGTRNGLPIALRNAYGKGEVVWIPSLIGIGAWEYGGRDLSYYLNYELRASSNKIANFSFDRFYENCYMEMLNNGHDYISVIVNENDEKKNIKIVSTLRKRGRVVYGALNEWNERRQLISLPGNSTVVIYWE